MNREITDKNLYLLLPSKVSLFVQLYIKEHGGSIIDAIRQFYHSNTYKALEKENTNSWIRNEKTLSLPLASKFKVDRI